MQSQNVRFRFSLKSIVLQDDLNTGFQLNLVRYQIKIICLAAITTVVPESVYYVKIALNLKNCAQAGFCRLLWRAWCLLLFASICLFYSFLTSHGQILFSPCMRDYKQETLKFLFTYKTNTNIGPHPKSIAVKRKVTHTFENMAIFM